MGDLQRDEKIKRFLKEASGATAESAAGAAIGFIMGGPIVAATGAAGPLLALPIKHVLGDMLDRVLSSREQLRIADATIHAANKIQERLQVGSDWRDDGFFETNPSGRSDADDLLEGVLLKCRNEHEEKKCKYIGHIFANIAFRPDVSVADANQILAVAQALTYRQIAIIALVHRAADLNLSFSWGRAFTKERRASEPALWSEVHGLPTGLVHALGSTEDPPFLDPLGLLLFELMSLEEFPKEELQALAELIRGRSDG